MHISRHISRYTKRCSVFGVALVYSALSSTPAMAQQSGPDVLSETYRDWVVVCQTADAQNDGQGIRVCEMKQELRQQESGQRVLSVALRPEEDAGAAFLTLITPFGLRVAEQIQISVDEVPVLETPFQTCLPQGCIVQTRLDQAAIDALQRGEAAVVSLPTTSGDQFRITISLLGFTAAWNRLSDL